MRYPRTLACANRAICDELDSPQLTSDEQHELALIHCHHISDEERLYGRTPHVIAARELQRQFFEMIFRGVRPVAEPDFEVHAYEATVEDWEARR